MTIKAMIDGVWHSAIDDSPESRARRVAEKEKWLRNRIAAGTGATYPATSGRYHL